MHVFLSRIVLYQCKKMLLISRIRFVFQLFCYANFKITFHYLNLRNIYLLDFNILPTFAMNINYYIYSE